MAGHSNGSIANVRVTGNVSGAGNSAVGGIAGQAEGLGALTDSVVTGSVTGASNNGTAGGLVGTFGLTSGQSGNRVDGQVSGGAYTGGLIGYYDSAAAISDGQYTPASISGGTWTGGLVGYMNKGSIVGASAGNPLVVATNVTSLGSAGGVAGRTIGAVSNVRATGSVSGGGDVGGLVGRAEGAGGISSSSATGDVSGPANSGNVGGLVGNVTAGSIVSSSASGAVSRGYETGGLVGAFTSNSGSITGSTASGNVTSTAVGGDAAGLVGYASGSGSVSNSSASGNVSAANNADGVGGLAGELRLSGGIVNSSAGAAASGGNPATTVRGGTYTGGVVGYYNASTALVTDSVAGTAVTFNGTSVSGSTWVGGIAGYMASTAAITGVTSDATVTSLQHAGGLAGSTGGLVSNAHATGNVSGGSSADVGGLIGLARGSVSASTASGDVTSGPNGSLGGLIGRTTGTGTLTNSTASGRVTGPVNSTSVGGLVGYYGQSGAQTGNRADGVVSGGFNTGGLIGYYDSPAAITDGQYTAATVSGGSWVGGLVGYMNSTAAITGPSLNNPLTVAANVTATGVAGGLVGRSNGSVSKALASGNVVSGGDGGGLIGRAEGNGAITGNVATGTVSGSGSNNGAVGGLVGSLSTSGGLSGNRADGSVSGAWYAGGIVGYYNAAAAITDGDYRGASVSGTNWAGGLVGYMVSTAAITGPSAGTPLTATANVSSGNVAGGLAARTNGAVSNARATGNVSAGGDAGGLVGRAEGAGGVSNSSAAGNVSGGSNAVVGGLIGLARASVSASTASGDVTSGPNGALGGLIGQTLGSGTLTNSSASGRVSGPVNSTSVGGLVGYYGFSGAQTGNRADGVVSGGFNTGGLIGYYNSTAAITDGQYTPASISGGTWTGGLVGYMTGGSVAGASAGNPLVVATNVVSSGNAGGLTGRSAGAITNVRTTGSVTGAGNSSVGGVVGQAEGSGAISNSSATGPVRGGAYAGGLVGSVSSGSISNSTASGEVSGTDSVGGLVGYFNSTGSITASSASGAAKGGSYAGGLVGQAFGSNTISASHASGNVTGQTYVGGLVGAMSQTALSGSDASGDVVAMGNGTIYAGGLVGNAGYYYGYYYGGGSITGSHASGSVNVDAFSPYAGGLVGYIEYGSVSNSHATGAVRAVDSLNRGSGYAGGLVGMSSGSASNISNSSASGAVVGQGRVGGLVGYFEQSTGSISASSSSGAVSGNGYVGGLVGQFYGDTISASSASGAVTASSGSSYAGGLAGFVSNNVALTDLSATGKVTSSGSVSSIGGLIGYLSGAGLTSGFASGDVSVGSGSGTSGGLVGTVSANRAGASLNDSAASGNVSGGGTAGGLVGYFAAGNGYGSIVNSRASGNVSLASTYAGGLVGDYESSSGSATTDIRNSFATGNVTVTAPYAGGLVGYYYGTAGIAGSYASGNVTVAPSSSYTYAGGLVGYYYNRAGTARGAITGSYASANVSVTPSSSASYYNFYAGGLVGALFGNGSIGGVNTVLDAYATGNVAIASGGANDTATRYAGGLIGQAASSMSRTFATGAVSALGGNSRFVGGLNGQLYTYVGAPQATDSYWDTTRSGQATSAGGTGLTTTQMMQSASFGGSWATNLATTGSAGKTWRIYEGLTTPLLTGLLTPLSLTLADATKTYDGNTSFGDASISSASGAVAFANRIVTSASAADVGSYAIGAAGVYSVQNGYDLNVTGSATLTVVPRPLTLAGVIADKVYDGTRAASVSGTGQPSGLVPGEDLRVDLSAVAAVFDTKNVGSGKAVAISGYALADGTRGKASNYSLANATASSASITPAPLLAGGFAATNRNYDGTTVVAVTATPSATVSGKFGSDDVNVDISAVSSGRVADKNAGTGKAVTVLGASLTGADAGNYRIAGIDAVTVDIAPKTLSASGLTASNRNYDRGTTVSVSTTAATLGGVVAGDAVQLDTTGVSGTMADKNVGTAKAVTVPTLSLRGPDAANYRVAAGATTVNISPYTLDLYVSRTNSTDRVYNGTADANVAVNIYPYSGDAVSLNYSAPTYSDKNVAYSGSAVVSKTITVSGASLSGADARNYALSSTSNTTSGTISPKPLAVTGVTAVNRSYDGTRDVSVNVAGASVDTAAVISGDNVSVSLPGGGTVTGTMADKNVGTGKAVTVPGFALTGADRGNYTLSGSSGVRVDIARKDLTASYTGVDKVYDGSVYAQVSATSGNIVAGDSVDFLSNYYSGYYYGYCYYSCAVFTGAGAKNVGTGKAISVTSDGLYGTDAGNYRFVNAGSGSASASITPKAITAAFTGADKVYDGTAAATVTLNASASGIVGGDSVSSTQTAVFTGPGAKNVGNGKAIAVSGVTFSGADASNYTPGAATGSAIASITPKAVTLSGISATDRVYDGTTTVAVTAGTVTSSGFIGGDAVAVQLPAGGLSTGTVASKNIGSAKPVTVTGLSLVGGDAPNYAIDAAGSGIRVNITPRPLTVAYTGVNRTYNGGVSAAVVASSADIVGGDAVGFSQSAVFTGINARDVGSAKPISVTGIAKSGTDAANYALQNTTATAAADITAKPLTVNYAGVSRVYNGVADVSAAVIGSSADVVALDTITYTQNASFRGDGSAGNGKTIDVSGIALGGAQAGNYALTSTTATTSANITRKPIGVTGIAAADRSYDGTNVVAINVAGAVIDASAVIAADRGAVTVAIPPSGISTGTIATKDAGASRDVTVSGLAIGGSMAANYALVGATGLTVNIAPRALTANYAGLSKVYDGSVAAAVAATSADILAGDVGAIDIKATGVFAAGKDVGSGKTVNVSGGFLDGVERNNYALQNPTGTASADITPKPLAPSYAGLSRVYDGGTAAPVRSTTAGIVLGDAVSFTESAQFTGAGAKNVGSVKPIAVSGIAIAGADAANYALTATTAVTTGSVTPKTILVGGLTNVTATDRSYDGTRTVAVDIPASATLVPRSSDIVGGDVVTIAVPSAGTTTGAMADKNVGANKAVVINGLSLSGADAGNYVVGGTEGVTVNITPRSLTAAYAGVARVYDGSANVAVTGTSADILGGDAVGISASGLFTGSGAKNVGSGKAILVTGGQLSGGDAVNYALQNPSGSATGDVTPRPLTASYTGRTRVYDGTVAAPVDGLGIGIVGGDNVSLSAASAVFTGSGAKNVGSNKPIQVSGIALSGADAGNYALTNASATTSGSVTPRLITIDGLNGMTATNRAYDGTTTVAVTVTGSGTPSPHPGDIVAGDSVTVSVPAPGQTTGTMADKRVGTGKSVAVTGLSLAGADRDNYLIAGAGGVTVDITPKLLTAAYAGVDKVYDGTTAATVTGASADIVSGDAVAIGASGVFTGPGARNVGAAKPIAVANGTLAGGDAANYTLANPTGSASADITPRPVTATYTGRARVYDGTTDAPVTATLAGALGGDSVDLSQTAVFSGPGAKNVGTAKPVAVSAIALGGADKDNYALQNSSATTTADVTPRPLTIQGLNGIAATDRVYDGTPTVAVNIGSNGALSPSSNDIVAGDQVTIQVPGGGQTSGTMADKAVGSNKPVVVAGFGLSGADAANYTIAGIGGVTVNIAPRPLGASYAGVDKVYDGNAAATVIASSADVLAGDAVVISASGVFTGVGAKNVGTAKPIAVSNGTLLGGDAANYALSNPTGSASADITPRPATPGYTGGSRVYDGGIAAPVTGTSADLVVGDSVALAQTAVFTGAGAKNAGIGKPVAVSGIALVGADAPNYQLTTTTATTTASVTPRPITVDGISGVQAVDRVYNGSRVVDVNVSGSGASAPTSSDIVAGDQVAIGGVLNGQTTGTMADKNAGDHKAVAISGLVLSGADAPNYTVGAIGGVSVNIAPARLNLSGLAAVDRFYDGTRTVAIDTRAASLGAAVAGDDVRLALNGLAGEMADKNVGNAKLVQTSGIALVGSDAANYRLDSAEMRVSIAPRPLVASYAGVDKVYDGTAAAAVSASSAGVLAGDAVAIGASGSFADKNVGAAKPVVVSQGALSGADAANYALSNPTGGASADITPRPVTPVYVGGTRVYDGGVAAPLAVASGDFVAGDSVALTQSAVFTGAGAKNAGAAKPVQVSGIALSGTDAANYALTSTTASTTANVTPRPLTASYAGVDKVYDGTAAAAVSATSADVLAGDALTIGASGSFADKNVGVAKPIAVSQGALSGADAANYALSNPTGSSSADITPRPLNVQARVADRVYDGSALAQPTLTDDRVRGDQLSVGSTSAAFADKNAGDAKPVTIIGITLSGTDAGNYVLGANTLRTLANILRAPATITASDQAKVYGDALSFNGNEFAASGLVAGETVGSVTLSSAGEAAAAAAGSYAITASAPRGGTFDAANYALTFKDGQLLVSPRPLSIAANTVVRYAGDPEPLVLGYAASVGGLVNGDRIGSASIPLSVDLANSPGGSVFLLTPSAAAFEHGSAANYRISYLDGLLVLLPRPPVIGQNGSNQNNSGEEVFVITVAAEDVANAIQALKTAAATAAQPSAVTPDRRRALPSDGAPPVADGGDGARQVSVPGLLRQPLVTLDPQMRRLIFGNE